MSRQYYSIFNDALGPVMTGPSSSHSAGCCRIGQSTRMLFGREITRAEVVFEEKGSYPSTYIGQGSNFGFTGGLLGMSTDDPRLKDAVTLAREWGRDIKFIKEDLGFSHPNQAEIRVYGEGVSPEMTLMTFSVGGGMFQITKMDGFSVMIDGGVSQIFIRTSKECLGELRKKLEEFGYPDHEDQVMGDRCLVSIRPAYGNDTSSLLSLSTEKYVDYVRSVDPVVPVVKRPGGIPPFFNAAEALEYAAKHGHSMWELCVDYENGYGYVDASKIEAIVNVIHDAMEGSIIPPDPGTTPILGFLPYQAVNMKKNAETVELVQTGFLNQAMLDAISVMENSCAHNIIVAAPTAGSSGVIPAAVVSLGHRMGKSRREICRALMAAGLTGVFIANQATFGGEVGACQAENGSASAMAAAGIVQLLGGTPAQGFAAAGMAMQNMLGLICDPVAGLTEIPCISRNVSAMANAVLSANMVMLGFDPVIPFDEVILTMGEVGAQLPAELRCTCGGGLCMTPSGCRLQKQVDESRPVL